MAAPVPFWFTSAVGLGALYASVVCFRLLAYLGLCLRRPNDLRRRYGSWAVLTGPTRGLGRSMALELARRGLSLVLVDLDPVNLREVSQTLRRTYAGVETKTVVFDLSLVSTARGDEAMRRLRAAIHGLDVGILVNNAGVIRPGALYVHEAEVERLVSMIRVNVLALTEVTAAVLPEMLKRGRGAIVNVGSGSTVAVPSFPLYTVYSATKRHHKQLQIQIFCSDDEKEGWGSTITTFADLPPSTTLRPSPLVLHGVAYWLCSLSDYVGHAYVLPLHLNGWRPPAPIWLLDKLTRMNGDIKKREVLLASSSDGKLALVTVSDKTITVWTLELPSYGCWRESFEVDLREVARRSRGMVPLTDEKIKLECFAERSGAVLFRIYHGTLFELNLRTRKIKYLGLYSKSGSSNMCAHDMN